MSVSVIAKAKWPGLAGPTPLRGMRLSIIAAALPPKLDGIGDYTAQLAKELALDRDVNVEILTDRNSASDCIAGVEIRGTFDPDDPRSVESILPALRARPPDWVLLQYNPFSYGRRGLNLYLPGVMRRVRETISGVRLAVMFHEMFVPINRLNFAVMTTYQRWQFFQLGRTADVLFFSIEPWARRFARWFPSKPVLHLPVGSNIARVEITSTEAKGRLGIEPDEIVLGVFGTAHISRSLGVLQPAGDAVRSTGNRVRVLYVGPDQDVIRQAAGNLPILCAGRLEPDDVSKWLSAVDIFLAAYVDGISTRRGAMMAALQHSLATVGTTGHHTDPELRALHGKAMLLAQVNRPKEFTEAVRRLAMDAEQRALLGRRAAEWFDMHYSWGAIAGRMVGILQRTSRGGSPDIL